MRGLSKDVIRAIDWMKSAYEHNMPVNLIYSPHAIKRLHERKIPVQLLPDKFIPNPENVKGYKSMKVGKGKDANFVAFKYRCEERKNEEGETLGLVVLFSPLTYKYQQAVVATVMMDSSSRFDWVGLRQALALGEV